MAAITIRNLDDEVQRKIKLRAAANNRSMEAEARVILSDAVSGADFARAWLDLGMRHRGDDLVIPARSLPRQLDLP
jgi:plasmid stability protein